MDALKKSNETSSNCPTVIVAGGFSVGKSTVINAVVRGCTKIADTSACSTASGIISCINEATSFIEIAPEAQREQLSALQTRKALADADAVWFVFRAGDAIAESDVEFYKECSKYVCERLFVFTHVDEIDEASQWQSKERLQAIFHDFEVEIDDQHVCFVNALKDSQELAARYLKLRERKKQRSLQRQQSAQHAEYDRYVQSGLLEFDFERYRDSVRYYCMPHDPETEAEFARTAKRPFAVSDLFKKRIRLVLQTPAPSLYLDHPDLHGIPSKGYDLIQAIEFGCEYWRDHAIDEGIASKAKYVVDTLKALDCEMGVAGNHPSVADYVIEILDYADRELKRQQGEPNHDVSSSGDARTTLSESCGAISGHELVERMLDRFDDDGVAKLLECTRGQETEFLEFKTSYLLREEEKKKGISQDALTWDIAQAIFAIANTSGGALVIGICDDGKSLHPVNVVDDDEKFMRCQIVQKLLPDQRCWSDGKGGRWGSRELPKVEPRLCHYSDGEQTGRVVVLLIEPQSRGRSLSFEDSVNRNGSLLCYREKGYGKTRTSKDSRNFSTIDNERRIQSHHYLTLLRKFIPDAGQLAIGQSSGAYRLKPVVGRDVDSCDDEVIVSTDGHRLRYQFAPSDRIGKYCVIEKLGQGGMGVVYRVKDTRLGREYALKAFMSTAEECQMQKERFMTEAKLLSKLDHEGLPKVYDCDYDRQNECLYLVEDLIVGEDNRPHELARFTCVQSAARSEGLELVSEDQSLKWLRQVCEIASYLHDNGVEHRDITLKNLLCWNTFSMACGQRCRRSNASSFCLEQETFVSRMWTGLQWLNWCVREVFQP